MTTLTKRYDATPEEILEFILCAHSKTGHYYCKLDLTICTLAILMALYMAYISENLIIDIILLVASGYLFLFIIDKMRLWRKMRQTIYKISKLHKNNQRIIAEVIIWEHGIRYRYTQEEYDDTCEWEDIHAKSESNSFIFLTRWRFAHDICIPKRIFNDSELHELWTIINEKVSSKKQIRLT